MKDDKLLYGLVIVVAILSVALILQKDTNIQNIKTIDVTGTAKYYQEPDIAYLYFSLETTADTAKEAGELNAQKMEDIRFALYKAGISKEDIETSGYYVYPKTRWVDGKSEIIGYVATQSLKVTYENVDEVGSLIDVVLEAGANRVDSISFDLKDETREELRGIALEEASINARTKADAIAKGLNVKIVGVKSVSVPDTYYYPYYRSGMESSSSSDGDYKAITEIDPGELSFSVSISVSFEIN